MTWLIYTGFLVAPVLSNLMPKYLPALQIFGAFFNISNGLIWAIVFLVMADKNSARFVFSEFINTSGWTSKGWVFILSMYVPIYGLYGTDAVLHCKVPHIYGKPTATLELTYFAVVEEMKNASRDAPVSSAPIPLWLITLMKGQRVMIWSMVWAGVTAWLSAIVMCYTVGPNWETYMEETSAYVV